MSEIRVTSVIGENGSDPVGLSTGFTVGPTSGTTATITHEGQASFTGVCTATAFAPTAGQLSHRNIIINGDLRIAQRATSTTSNGYAFVDRFQTNVANLSTGGNVTRSQQSLSSSDTGPWQAGFRKYVRMATVAAGTAAATSAIDFYTHIEAQDMANSGWDYNSASGEITLSFWFRCSANQTFYTYLRSRDGTQQGYVFAFTASGNNTWTKITHTIPGNSNITFDDNNGTGLSIYWIAYYGTDYTNNKTLNTWAAHSGSNTSPDMQSTWLTSGAATWDITGIQLEVGPVATPFEHRTYADELKRCRRYYFKTSRWMGGARGSSTSRSFTLDFGMRLTGSDMSSGTYTNDGTASGDVVYIGSNATRQVSNVTANSLSFSTSTNENQMSAAVIVGYGIGSGDNGIITGLYIGGFTIDHEL